MLTIFNHWPHERGDNYLDARRSPATKTRGHLNSQTLPHVDIDQRQRSKPPAVKELIGNEVHAPAFIHCVRGHGLWPMCRRSMALGAALKERQPLSSVKPVHAFVVHPPALSLEQHINALVAVAHPRGCQLFDTAYERPLIGRFGLIVKYRARQPQYPARLADACTEIST